MCRLPQSATRGGSANRNEQLKCATRSAQSLGREGKDYLVYRY